MRLGSQALRTAAVLLLLALCSAQACDSAPPQPTRKPERTRFRGYACGRSKHFAPEPHIRVKGTVVHIPRSAEARPGGVTLPDDYEPVAEAEVRISGSSVPEVTSSRGRFCFSSIPWKKPCRKVDIVVRKMGFGERRYLAYPLYRNTGNRDATFNFLELGIKPITSHYTHGIGTRCPTKRRG